MDRRCLIITYYFPPLGGGGVQRVTKLIKYVSRMGWRFTVITADEQSASIPVDETLTSEIPDNTEIIRIPVGGLTRKSGKLAGRSSYWKRWISAFVSIPDFRKKWIPKLRAVTYEHLKHNPCDCVIVSIPPYSLTSFAAELTQAKDVPVLLDMRDPWTMNPYKIYPTPLHRFLDRRLESALMSRINYGVSAYQRLIDFYDHSLKNFAKNNWQMIPNGYDDADFAGIQPAKFEGEKFHIGFSGTFYSHINNPEPLFKAVSLLQKTEPGHARKLRFHHVGKSMIPLDKLAEKHGVRQNIKCWGYQNHKRCLEILAGMNAFFFVLDSRDQRSVFTIGGKVYEYLRLKKPILALVPEEGDAADLIESTDSGCVVSALDPHAIAEVLLEWIKKPPAFSFRNIDQLSREHLAQRYHRFLEDIVIRHRST